MEPTELNVRLMWDRSTEGEREYGERWYPVAHKAAARIGAVYGFHVRQVSAVISALSPSNQWHQNLVDAEAYCEQAARKAPPRRPPSASTYPVGRTKAWDILFGMYDDPEDAFLTGTAMKTHAFFKSIAEPFTNLDTVVIDGHAWNIACGKRQSLREAGSIGKRKYEAAARCYIRTAIRVGVTPQAMQATCWIAWRRGNQYNLEFDDDLLLTTRRI
jgi:hypothetical protein